MNGMALLLPVALVVLLLASPVLAQEAPELLGSEEPAKAAWGAWLAGEHGLRKAAPALARLLAPRPDREAKEWDFVRLLALDALIRLDAPLSPELLLPRVRGRTWNAALILLLRAPRRNREALLTLFDRWWAQGRLYPGTIAVGNLLAATRAPELAPRLFRSIHTKLTLTVRDPGTDLLGGSSRSISMGCGDGIVRVPDGFPPYPHYALSTRRREGDVLLADGPRPVYALRTVRTEPRFGVSSSASRPTIEECAREWLGVLLGEEPGVPERISVGIEWRGPAEYLRRAVAERDARHRAFWDLVKKLVNRGLLSREEARALEAPVTVLVEDERTVKSPPLPELPETTVRLHLPEEPR